MSGSDARALARSLLDLCRMRKLTIATAESCTGGLVAGALTDIPGSSDVIDRGFITCSNEGKPAPCARGALAATARGEAAKAATGVSSVAAGGAALSCAGRLPVNCIRALFERRGKTPKRGVEHRAHQHGQHPALEFVSEVERDVAGALALRLERPAVFEIGKRPPQIPDRDLQIGTVEHYFAGEGFPHQLERHGHVGNHDLAAVGFWLALTDFQRLAQRHEFGITLDIGDEIEHVAGVLPDL